MTQRTPFAALTLFTLALLPACTEPADPAAPLTSAPAAAISAAGDPHSFANFDQVSISHLSLTASVDFASQTLAGEALLTLDRRSGADTLVLDTRALDIDRVTAGNSALQWRLRDAVDALGSALEIRLPDERGAKVRVVYRSSPQASGLQWLTPQQTAGKRHPFMFSQSQAIHARSWIPLQDTPAVRFTFDATIRVPPGLRAVMGASNDPLAELDGEFDFSMPQPIPSYLMAMAVGELDFAPLSERAGIYAEAQTLAAAAYEFADTEAMIQVAEDLFGPYRWGRYDLLILPPSFPFGGMENPRLSFITPTVIAGDRSLVSLIAHELAHSWSGNLVTNAAWNHMWLNEGFTVFLEARIMAAIYGPERAAMEAVLGYQSLLDDLEQLPDADERLVLDLAGRDADDAFSDVAYEKGRLFLVFLSQQMGEEAFNDWLRGYFDRHAFSSLTTDQFVSDLQAHWPPDRPLDPADLEAWLHQPGLPANAVLPQSDALTRVDTLREQWLSGELTAADLPTAQWSPQHWLHFLGGMPALEPDQLQRLDDALGLTAMGNNEIVHVWLRIAIERNYQPALARLPAYLKSIGRIKLIVPLYQDLMKQARGSAVAREIYAEARPGYHPLAQAQIDTIVR